jgi:hypothetical protein
MTDVKETPDIVSKRETLAQLKQEAAGKIPLAKGDKYTLNDKEYIYTGTNELCELLERMNRDNPDLVNHTEAVRMINDPLGYSAPPFQMDPAITLGLAALKQTGALDAMTGLAKDFLGAGLDGPISAVTGAIKNLTGALPFSLNGAADIVNSIGQVKVLMQLGLSGPTSLIFAAINGNLLSGIPGLADLAKQIPLSNEIASLTKLAANPIGFAAKAAGIQANFPMLNMNAMAGVLLGAAASGKKPNFATLVPNLVLASGILKMLPKVTIAPTKDAEGPKKLKPPTKPIDPIVPKNLFAESAAGSSLATLKQPLSQFMGIMSTIAPRTNLIKDSPSKTSYGTQKLVGNANTVNWGSGGYGRDNSKAQLEAKRMEISSKIEKHTSELLEQVDYTKLTKYSYPDLIKKYPAIKPTSTVAEALHIIDVADKAEAAKKANTSIMTT